MNRNILSNTTYKQNVMNVLGITMLAFAMNATAYTGQKLAGEAKVSLEQARATALQAHPGKVADEELEKEDGGSGLRYSFDIRNGNTTQEVGVDAQTGKVLENKPEGNNPD